MKNGIIGALVGLLIGLMIGTALFGPTGGGVGAILGAVLGLLIVTPLSVVLAHMTAKDAFSVTCPETHEEVQVTLDPKQVGRAELLNQRKRIATCSRVNGRPDCPEDCIDQIDI